MKQKRSAQEREGTKTFYAFSSIHCSQITYPKSLSKIGDTASDAATGGYIMCSHSFSPVHQTSPTETHPSWFIKWDVFTPKRIWKTHLFCMATTQQSLSHQNTQFGGLEVEGELRAKHCLLLGDSLPPQITATRPRNATEMKIHFTYSEALFSPWRHRFLQIC